MDISNVSNQIAAEATQRLFLQPASASRAWMNWPKPRAWPAECSALAAHEFMGMPEEFSLWRWMMGRENALPRFKSISLFTYSSLPFGHSVKQWSGARCPSQPCRLG